MSRFEDHVFESISGGLTEAPRDEAEDAYAISLWVEWEDDDGRMPAIVVGFNTHARVRVESAAESDEAEVRWNFAYWLQNELAVVAHTYDDPKGAALRKDWIEGLGLWYSDEDRDRWDEEVDERAGRIVDEFFALTVRVVQRLHASGVVERAFGRRLPVLIHELEYYDAIAEYNRAANPPDLVADFLRWMEERKGPAGKFKRTFGG